jgi:hypothetical protein
VTTLTLDLDINTRGVNQVMYQRDLKIQKGIKNQIRIQFKNSDQKNVKISSTQTFVFSMFDATEQRLLIEKNLDVLDINTTSTRGQALLTLTENDTIDLPKSNYTYSVKVLDTDGSYLPAYSNTYYGMSGTLHLTEEIYPKLIPSQEIKSFLSSFNGDTNLYEHKSDNVYAYPEYNGNSALHTVALYMTGFRGTVHLQATMYNTPAAFDRYATITSRTYSNFTGVDYINFNGVYSYIRLMYIPATKPGESTNDNPLYFGSFDKVLYRN